MKKSYILLAIFIQIYFVQANKSDIGCPSAGLGGTIVLCDSNSTPTQLFFLLTGANVGGTWTRTSGTGGIFDATFGTFLSTIGATSSTFTYSILGSGPCLDDSSVATVIINSQPNAGFDGCISVADTSTEPIVLNNLISGEDMDGVWTRTSGVGGTFNAISGTYTPAIGAISSTFSYVLAGILPCISDSSIATVIINGAASQSVNIFCDPSLVTSANSVFFDWNNNVGIAGFNFSYTINSGPIVRGSTILSSLEVFNLPNGESSVTITVQPIDAACYSPTTFTCGTLAIADLKPESIAHFPNPFTDILNLKFNQSIKSIQISNLLGQQVFGDEFNQNEFQINLSHLSSGTYIVKAASSDSIETFKIVKK